MKKPIVWVSIFPGVQQNTLHYTPDNVIPLLCYVVTQSLEALGWGECVCIHYMHTHLYTDTHINTQSNFSFAFSPWNNSLAVSHKVICRSITPQTAEFTAVTKHTAPLLTINTHRINGNTQSPYSPAVQLWLTSNAPQISKTSVHYLHMAASSPDQRSSFYLHKPVPFIRFKWD